MAFAADKTHIQGIIMTTDEIKERVKLKPATWIALCVLVLAIITSIITVSSSLSARPDRKEVKVMIGEKAPSKVDFAKLKQDVRWTRRNVRWIRRHLEKRK